MGYAAWRSWMVTQLETIDDLNVYGYPTDKVNYPAAIVKVGESSNDVENETNLRIKRDYEINIDLVVGANDRLQNIDDVERIFSERLDDIVELFDAAGNRHPLGSKASRQRLLRIVPRDSINPEAKRIATITLGFYKLTGMQLVDDGSGDVGNPFGYFTSIISDNGTITTDGPTELNILGGSNIDTEASGDTITINATIPTPDITDAFSSIFTDDGQVDASGDDSVNILGGTDIEVSVVGGDITIDYTGTGGSGDVTGPASALNNQLSRFDGTTGKAIKAATATVDDNGTLTLTTGINISAFIVNSPSITTQPAFSLQDMPLSTNIDTGKAFEIKVTGESNGRVMFYSDGKMGLGGGSGGRDIYISRRNNGQMMISTDGNGTGGVLVVPGSIATGSNGLPVSSMTVRKSTNTLADVGVDANYYFTAMNTSNTNGSGQGIAFKGSSGASISGAIISVRTGGNGQGELRFYVKTSTVDAVAPELVQTIQNDKTVRTNGLTNRKTSEVLADDASITLTTGVAGFGFVQIGDNQEYAQFVFTAAGVVTLIHNSANAVNTDTDGNLCIFDNGSGIAIRNRLGNDLTIRLDVNYS